MLKQWRILKLMNKEKDNLSHTSKRTYISRRLFHKSYAAIHEIKPVLILKKSIYVGFIVLEWSKWLMYDFHYNLVKRNCDAELLFTDTDSPICKMKSEDVYEECFKWKHLFDFSEFQSKFFDLTNQKGIGKMRDVHKGKQISELVGLK